MAQATNRRSVTVAVMVATFLTAMDSTVVSTAMPTIVSDLGGLGSFSWVFAVYLLTTAVTTPIWGKLADLFGRKLAFTAGTAVFLAGSVLSGFSHSMGQLILFRALQGIGAGAVMPITLTIIGDIYTFEERARVQGLFSGVWGISGILGPLIGGFFVDWLSWRWIFYINVPIGLASMLLVWVFLHESFMRQRKHIDYAGAITFTVGISALLYALLSGGSQYRWNSGVIFALFAVALVALVVFVALEARSPEPMVPLRLFTRRVISVSNGATFLASAILIGVSAYLPLWIQGILGHAATSAGLTLAPLSIGWPVGATVGGRLMLRIDPKVTSLAGMVAVVVGTMWLAVAHVGTPQWVFVAIMLIIGFGFGFSMTAFMVVIQSVVGWNMRGAATASNQFVRALGQTVGVAAFGTWFNHAVERYTALHHIDGVRTGADMNRLLNPGYAEHAPATVLNAIRATLAAGLHTVFEVMAGIAVVALVVVVWLPRIQPLQKNRQSAQPSAQGVSGHEASAQDPNAKPPNPDTTAEPSAIPR
ncbi:MAG: MFS transporter [Alicyclobacillaceae bacterium]|nr:MFS transporter [Alicyclobacillaceae bacterium]